VKICSLLLFLMLMLIVNIGQILIEWSGQMWSEQMSIVY
jgi:hypothetical protein